MFTTFLPDRGRFRICSTVNVFKRMSTSLQLSSRRVTAALIGLLCSLLLDHSGTCDFGWLGQELPFLGAIIQPYVTILQLWVSAPGAPGCLADIWPHLSTTVMLMSHRSHYGITDVHLTSIAAMTVDIHTR